jgi:hypothetical protein
MNLEDWIEQTWAQSPPRAARQEDTGFSEVKIEPCDFERLLERAMEILNARAPEFLLFYACPKVRRLTYLRRA